MAPEQAAARLCGSGGSFFARLKQTAGQINTGIFASWCYYSTQMIEGAVRHRFGDYLSKAEVVIYSVLAVLLSITALVPIAGAVRLLWDAMVHRTLGVETLRVLDQLLVVLMLVEI